MTVEIEDILQTKLKLDSDDAAAVAEAIPQSVIGKIFKHHRDEVKTADALSIQDESTTIWAFVEKKILLNVPERYIDPEQKVHDCDPDGVEFVGDVRARQTVDANEQKNTKTEDDDDDKN